MEFDSKKISQKAKALFLEERSLERLDGWFISREIAKKAELLHKGKHPEIVSALSLYKIAEELPISISENAIFAGTQRDAFARSYALINPSFTVEGFSGYCDPTAVYNDIEPNNEFSKDRIEAQKSYAGESPFVKALSKVNEGSGELASEAVFFVEQVTGHLIPDFKRVIKLGIDKIISEIEEKIKTASDSQKIVFEAMIISLNAVLILAERYKKLAEEQMKTASEERKTELSFLADILSHVPKNGAESLAEAIQTFMLLWQVMCLEQAPNPFAFSVGNADRIFEPYRAKENLNIDITAALLKHFLVFFNVGDRSWAISQNILAGGKSIKDEDLTNPTTYAILDSYFDMNLPQPILSVKLHKNTPDELYKSLGRFFFTAGCLTPSLFNDDSVFEVLRKSGVSEEDLENYSVAGCQEPLIMGKDNGNTTNSWLNMSKILELTLNNGKSTITGKKLGPDNNGMTNYDILSNIRELFYKHTEYFIEKMTSLANDASKAIGLLPVPFLSVFMGGLDTGIDTRDTEKQGTKYNGSGCLIHGLSIIADSFTAIDCLIKERPEDADRLINALNTNFSEDEELWQYLNTCPKYGNNERVVDNEAREIVIKISNMIKNSKNYLGNPFRPDYSSPSTHLLYGYHTGATPDGRKAREMLGYGIDPLYGEASQGMGFRVHSNMKLPFECMNGGYASHFGIDPKFFTSETLEEKGLDFKKRVVLPLFFNKNEISPFYLYVNVTTPEILKKVLENPKKYAPSGVYIMRIHGTFVNFLDLSPAIQTDIIKRLDLNSTC